MVIWFPEKVTYHYYMGSLPDGQLAEGKTEEMTIRRTAFNVDIPDEKFAFEFPPEAKVQNNLNRR